MKPFPPWVGSDETVRLTEQDEHEAIQEIVLDEREELLKVCQLMSPYWRGFKSSEISLLADKIDLLKLGEGEYLARNREQACFFGVYLKGHADVRNERRQKIGQLSAGDILGEFTFFSGGFRGADIVTRSRENIVAIFPFQDFISLYLGIPKIASKIIYVLGWTGFSRIVEMGNKRKPQGGDCGVEEQPKAAKGGEDSDAEQGHRQVQVLRRGPRVQRAHRGHAALRSPWEVQALGSVVFKQKCQSTMVVLVVQGILTEGENLVHAGEFGGESALLQDNIEWSFRRHDLKVKSMATVIGFKVSDVHELISNHVRVGLTMYVNIARSWLLRFKKVEEDAIRRTFFFDVDHTAVLGVFKKEALIKAVRESQIREKEMASKTEEETMKKLTRVMARKMSIALAEFAPFSKGKTSDEKEEEDQPQKVIVLKDLDYNADMLHSCLCYSQYLKGFKQRQIDVLSSVMTFVEVKSGEQITRRGEFASFVGFIVSGGAESINEGTVTRELVTGDVIGEVELFLGGTRGEDIVSSSDNTVIAYMTFKQLLEIAQRQPKLCIKLMNSLLNAAVSRSRRETYSVIDSPESNLSAGEIEAVVSENTKEGLGRLFKPFMKEGIFANYLRKAKILRIPEGTPGMTELLFLPNSVYVADGTMEIRVEGVDKVNAISNAFIPDFRLVKSDSIFNIESAHAATDCTIIIFEHKLIKEMRREYPLLAVAFQLLLCKINLNSCGHKVETAGAVAKSMRVGEKALTKTEKLRMESIMAKKQEQYKEELKKSQLKKRMKKKNARMRKKKQTLSTAVKDAAKESTKAKKLKPVQQANSELYGLLDNMQFLSRCFRQFTMEELRAIAAVMHIKHYKQGDMIIKKGDQSSFVVFVLAGKAGINIQNKQGQTLSKIELKVGDILGKMALFEGGVRSADVISSSDDTVVGILEFKGIVECHSQNPKLGLKLIHVFVLSVVSKLRAFYLKQTSPEETYPKEQETECTPEVINNSGIFSSLLTEDEVELLCKSMKLIKYAKGDMIVQQGSLSKNMFIIVSGIVKTGSSNSTARVAHRPGYIVGADILRPETIIRFYQAYADEDSLVAVLPYDKFMELNLNAPQLTFKLVARMAQEIVWIESEILRQKIGEEDQAAESGTGRFQDWTQSVERNETLLNDLDKDPSKYAIGSNVSAHELVKGCQKHSSHFHGFEAAEIEFLTKRVKTISLKKDQYIVMEGDDACFVSVILEGSATVRYKGNPVGKLEAGDVLGELSLFERFARGADVIVSTDTSLVTIITFQDLRDIHKENPNLGLKVLRSFTNAACSKLKRRCLNNIKEESLHVMPCSNDKLYHLLQRSHKKSNGLGDEMDDTAIQYLAERMCLVKFESGDLILKRGQKASYVMFVLEGQTGVRIDGNIIAKRDAGSFIGETAFFQGFKEEHSERTADVVADGQVLVAAVSYKQLEVLNERHPLVALLLFSRIGELQVQRLRGQSQTKQASKDDAKEEADSDSEEEKLEAESSKESMVSRDPSSAAKEDLDPSEVKRKIGEKLVQRAAKRSSFKAPALGEIMEEAEEDLGDSEDDVEEIVQVKNGLAESKKNGLAPLTVVEAKSANGAQKPVNGVASIMNKDIDEIVARRIDAVVARRQSIREQARRQSQMFLSSGVFGGSPRSPRFGSALAQSPEKEEKKVEFTHAELADMVIKCKSMIGLGVSAEDEPSKEEILRIFDEALPKIGMVEEERRDILETTFNYETKIRKLETENIMLKEEVDVQGSDLENLYMQPHVLDFFESRLERLQRTLNDKVQDWQDEKERADRLSDLLDAKRRQVTERDAVVKSLKQELDLLKDSFGSLTHKDGRPRPERVPRHIETLQRSRSQSPQRSLQQLRSERSYPSPSLEQRLLLSRQRAATAQLTPVTKNRFSLHDRPSTQMSTQDSGELLDIKSALSFDNLEEWPLPSPRR